MNYKDYFRDLQEHRDQKGVFHVSGVASDNIRYHGKGLSPLEAIWVLAMHTPTNLHPDVKRMELDGTNGVVFSSNCIQAWGISPHKDGAWFKSKAWWLEVMPAQKAGHGVIKLDGTPLSDYAGQLSNFLGKYMDLHELGDYDIHVVLTGVAEYFDRTALCREAVHGAFCALEFSWASPDQTNKFTWG